MSTKIMAILAVILVAAAGGAVFAFGSVDDSGSSDDSTSSDDGNAVSQTDDDDSEDDDSSTWKDTGTDVVVDGASGVTLTYVSGTEACYEITQNSTTHEYTLTFSGITEDTVYMISGTLTGSIVINVKTQLLR